MTTTIAGGASQSGTVIGNVYDKYGSRNPIVRWMMNGFETALSDLVRAAAPSSIHEIGCGEGHWVLRWHADGRNVRGCDFSSDVIDIARRNAEAVDAPASLFSARSIYDLDPAEDQADLLVCCEVLEHLTDPEAALEALGRLRPRHLILSVPREPIWCALNLARGKYITRAGNTPGHIQHWSKTAFTRMVAQHFEIVEVRSPFPWTMLLCRPRG